MTTGVPAASASSSATPQAAAASSQFQPAKPNYDPFGLATSPSPGPPTSITPAIAQVQQQSTPKPADPFAILSQTTQTPRQGSPFHFQQSIKPSPSPTPASTSSSALLDIAGGTSSPAPAASTADDEWEFASALPDQAVDLTLTNARVNITWNVRRDLSDANVVLIQSRTSNNSDVPMSNFTFQVAVPKVTLPLSLPSILAVVIPRLTTHGAELHPQDGEPVVAVARSPAAERDHADHPAVGRAVRPGERGAGAMEGDGQHPRRDARGDGGGVESRDFIVVRWRSEGGMISKYAEDGAHVCMMVDGWWMLDLPGGLT